MQIQTGQAAPELSLYNTNKDLITLSSLRGKPVLLLFFPLAFTGVCTKELCMTRDNLTLYNDLDTTVLGISVDSPFSLKRFKEDNQINFDLLSDFNKRASRDYGCLYDTFVCDMEGVAKRSAFVVDAAGVIRYAEVLESAGDIPDFDAIKTCLEGLKG